MNRRHNAAPALGGRWDKLNPSLNPWISKVVEDMGFTNMTPVQAGTIPRAVKNQDCVVEAVTGSGKTLAFVIPILERLVRSEKEYKKGEVAAVVIAPTRELAAQIHEVFNTFLSSLTPNREASPIASSSRSPSPAPPAPYSLPCLITSGTPTPYETFLAQSSNILIGTPGRLASFLLSPRGQAVVKVSDLDCLVLDEADRLLSSPDHRRDVERIMRHLPKQRRTHLFSATMTDAVEEMIGLGLRNPVRIVVNLKDKRTGEEAKERRIPMRYAEKTLQLVRLLQAEARRNEAAKFIVYFSTCAAVDHFYRMPALSSFSLFSLHGDLVPRIRETSLTNFTSHPSSHLSPAVLLCTDVASRGVDFADIDVVIQYDPPTDPKTFSHRAGRTARAGRAGKAIVLLAKGREEDYVDFLSARKIPVIKQPYLDDQLNEVDALEHVDPGSYALLKEMRKLILADRDLHDRAAKAFVSSLRAYTKHEASFIFRLADIDFHSMAIAYGLLRLPVMPEIKEWRKKREAFAKEAEKKDKEVEIGAIGLEEVVEWQDAEMEWDSYAYASKPRETARQAALVEKRSQPPRVNDEEREKKRKIKAKMGEAWSEQKEKRMRKEDRRDRKDKRKQAEWEKLQAEGGEVGMVEQFKREKAKVSGKDGEEDRVEWDKDYKEMKKQMKERKSENASAKLGSAEGGMFDDLT